jgi:hypothetical protein
METLAIIGATAAVFLFIVGGVWYISRRSGQAQGEQKAALDAARAEAAGSAAVAEELAKERDVDSIVDNWGKK